MQSAAALAASEERSWLLANCSAMPPAYPTPTVRESVASPQSVRARAQCAAPPIMPRRKNAMQPKVKALPAVGVAGIAPRHAQAPAATMMAAMALARPGGIFLDPANAAKPSALTPRMRFWASVTSLAATKVPMRVSKKNSLPKNTKLNSARAAADSIRERVCCSVMGSSSWEFVSPRLYQCGARFVPFAGARFVRMAKGQLTVIRVPRFTYANLGIGVGFPTMVNWIGINTPGCLGLNPKARRPP